MTTRRELIEAIGARYRGASRSEKQKILDEFVALTGCHRKHAIRVLSAERVANAVERARNRVYDEATRQALIVLWEAADRVCGKRLKAARHSFERFNAASGNGVQSVPRNWCLGVCAKPARNPLNINSLCAACSTATGRPGAARPAGLWTYGRCAWRRTGSVRGQRAAARLRCPPPPPSPTCPQPSTTNEIEDSRGKTTTSPPVTFLREATRGSG